MKNEKKGLMLKNYYCFNDSENILGGNLTTPDSWDALRTKKIGRNQPFLIHEDRDQWNEFCLSNEEVALRVKRLLEILGSRFNSIDSFGVGNACLEFLIKKGRPSMQVRCSDFAPKSVERLKTVFPEADNIAVFDMLKEQWPTVKNDSLCLLHRVDAEFNDLEWEKIFDKIKCAGIQNVLFIPCEVLTAGAVLKKKVKYLIFSVLRRKMTFAGFIRTQKRFISLMEKSFYIKEIITIHDVKGFWLTPKED